MWGPRTIAVICLFSVLSVLVLGVPSPAAAQSDQELAKTYYNLGEDLYNRSDYEGALKQFQQSFKYSQQPALLFNMARCFESLGQHHAAIEHYTQFLASKPPNSYVIEARIKNLQRLVEKKTPPPAPSSPPVDVPSPTMPQATTPDRPEEASLAIEPKETESDTPSETEPSARPLRLPGWILVGSGAALVLTGAILGASASAKQSELEDANKAGQEYSDIQGTEDTGKTLEKGAIATLVIGGAATAAGVVLLILDAKRPREGDRAWIAPSLIKGGAVFVGGLRF